MDPNLLRGNFALALFILVLALLILPFQDRSSGAFVVTILAIVVAFLFIGAIALVARWSAPRIPKERYKGRR
jgi:hypothetical protein